jgi:hypothetical protein
MIGKHGGRLITENSTDTWLEKKNVAQQLELWRNRKDVLLDIRRVYLPTLPLNRISSISS